MINGKNRHAIFSSSSYGAVFGAGHDLVIYSDGNAIQSLHSNLGNTYQPPAGYHYGTQQTQTLFAGSFQFKPTEVEVFY